MINCSAPTPAGRCHMTPFGGFVVYWALWRGSFKLCALQTPANTSLGAVVPLVYSVNELDDLRHTVLATLNAVEAMWPVEDLLAS